MTREYTCQDCGVEVIMVAPDHANDQDLCGSCKWLRGIDDPVKRQAMRELLIAWEVIPK